MLDHANLHMDKICIWTKSCAIPTFEPHNVGMYFGVIGLARHPRHDAMFLKYRPIDATLISINISIDFEKIETVSVIEVFR